MNTYLSIANRNLRFINVHKVVNVIHMAFYNFKLGCFFFFFLSIKAYPSQKHRDMTLCYQSVCFPFALTDFFVCVFVLGSKNTVDIIS